MLPSPFKIIQEYSVVRCLLHYMTAHKWGWGILLCHMTQLVMPIWYRHSCTKDISMAANSFAVWQECSSSESIFSNLTLWQEKVITQPTKLLLWELSQVGWCRCGTRWGVVLDKCRCGHEKPLTSKCYLGTTCNGIWSPPTMNGGGQWCLLQGDMADWTMFLIILPKWKKYNWISFKRILLF